MKRWIIELWHYRELLSALTVREVKIRYKQTLLGAFWAILQPGALTVIFTLIFGVFLKVDSGSVPYSVFAYSALLPWTFFSTALSFGALSVVNNGSLVTKVYFPREMLPLASVGAAFFDFLMASIIFILMLIAYKIPINQNVLFIFFIVPSIVFLITGFSLIAATLNVLWRDIRFIIPLLLQIWLYLTPVIYAKDAIPEEFSFLYLINPLSPLIQSFREVTILGKAPNFGELLFSSFLSLSIFWAGYWFFKKKERIFADVI